MHRGSAVELKERLEAERRGEPFLIYRDDEGTQRLLALADGPPRLTIGPDTLQRLQALASRVHPDVRVLPQLHQVLGIP